MENGSDGSSQLGQTDQLNREFIEEFWHIAEEAKLKSKSSPVSHMIKFFLKDGARRCKVESWVDARTEQDENAAKKQKSVAEKSNARGVALFVKPDDPGKPERLKKCLEEFNTAICHSSFSDEGDRIEASKRFANRSAAFFDMERYGESLKDIEVALRLGYPFPPKVWIRKAKVLLAQEKYKEAREAVTFIKQCLTLNELELEKVQELVKRLVRGEKRASKPGYKRDYDDPDVDHHNSRRYNRKPFVENPAFEHAANSINIVFNPEKTRHVVASEDVEAGDILFDEIPFASILLPDCIPDYCYHCHAYLKGYFVPCKTCSEVKYCNEECGLEAGNEYHNVECGNTSLLRKVGLLELATRVVLKAGVDEVLQAVAENGPDDTLGHLQYSVLLFRKHNGNDPTNRVPYLRIYSLHHHLEKMNPLDVLTYAKTAAGITSWLQRKTSFFKGRTEDEVFTVGGAIIRHLAQLISNAQRLYSFGRDLGGGLLDDERIVIGSGIYACTSLMNHSCDPNISTNYKYLPGEGRRLIVKAMTKISAGEEVCNSYGVTYRRHDLETRKSGMLQQYYFNCTCKNCQLEETTGRSFSDQFESLRCSNPSCLQPIPLIRSENESASTSCPKCANTITKTEQETILANAEQLVEEMMEMNGTLDCPMFQDTFQMLEKLLPPFHGLLGKAHDFAAKTLLRMGDLDGAVVHLGKSMSYASERFGPSSNEFGIELRKYAQAVNMTGAELGYFGEKTRNLTYAAGKYLENYFPSTD